MGSAEENAVRAYWDEVWTRGDVSGVRRFYADTFLLNGVDSTPDEFAEGVPPWRAHFTDFTATVDQLFSCGSRVVSRVIYGGRHTGDFKRVPTTGRTIDLSGIDIFVFRDGKVVEHWHETDHLEMFRQLGADVGPAAEA